MRTFERTLLLFKVNEVSYTPGQIVCPAGNGYWLIDLFDGLNGAYVYSVVVDMEHLTGCKFADTQEHLQAMWDVVVANNVAAVALAQAAKK
jgi:hypothetical protein